MPELTDAQKAVLTDEQQKHYDHHKKCDKDGQSCISVRSLISLADARIKSEARREILDKVYSYFIGEYANTDNCSADITGFIAELGALLTPKGE